MIPLEPYPIFLGIQFDPKLCFKKLFESLDSKVSSKINLIRRIKGLRLSNSTLLCKTIFKNFIRTQFDYAFIPLSSSTQKILNDVQILQNKILRHIKFFPIKTKVTDIHKALDLDMTYNRSNKILKNYLHNRLNHQQLIQDLNFYSLNSSLHSLDPKYITLFKAFDSILNVTKYK